MTADTGAEHHRAGECWRLSASAGEGAPLVISFGHANWQAQPGFDFERRLGRLGEQHPGGINCLFLRDPENAWYQYGVPGLGTDPIRVAAALAPHLDRLRPGRVVTLGQSMGAYAALLFAHLLGADRAVAFGSLSLLDARRAEAIGDRRWLPVMERLAADPPANAVTDLAAWCARQPRHPALRLHAGMLPEPETPGAVVNVDLWHAQRLAVLPNALLQVHPLAGHTVVQQLAQAGELDALLRREILGDDAAPSIPQPSRPPQPRPVLDPGWRQWVAENRLRRCEPAGMVAGMIANGVDPALARDAVAQVEQDPAFLAGRKIVQLHDKLASVMGNLQRLWSSSPHYRHVERRSRVSRDEFVERYVRGCRPLVLTDLAADWPAMRRWSFAALKSGYGEHEVEVQAGRDADTDYEVNKLALRRHMRLAEFIDRIAATGTSNDLYLTANNELMRRPEFAPLLDDVGSQPDYCRREALAGACSLWLGPAGTVTPLHHDTLMLLHTQVVGSKRWRFISPLEGPKLYNHVGVFSPIDLDRPDPQRHPDFNGVEVLETVVGPGETVFLPLGWWHQVTALEASISFSYTNLDVPNTFSYANPDIRNW